MITKENLSSHELIGLQSKIKESTNSQIIGANGLIVDESKFMFAIKTKHGTKKIPKQNNFWEFTINDSKVTIDGRVLTKRPHDRIGATS